MSLSDYDVPLSQISETALMKLSAETFSEYNYFTKNRQSQVYKTHKENADLIWLLCYLYWQSKENSSSEGDQEMCHPASITACNQNKFETWAAFNSLSATEKVSKANRGVIGPLIRSLPTSPQTLYTDLCLAQKINVSVVGIHRRTVITLDLDLYERTVKIRENTGHRNSWVLRMGELHIMFTLLRSLGRYIEGSGLDDIWIEKGFYGPAVIRQIFGGKHLKHGVEAHMVNLLALSGLYYDALAKENPQMENLVTSLLERLCKAVQERDLPNIVPEIEDMTNAIRDSTVFDVLESFDKKLKDNAKFLRSYMKQIENLLKFI